jgi:hypothetical protein
MAITVYQTSYEKYGTQKITVAITNNQPFPLSNARTGVFQFTRTTEIPTHPHNNSVEQKTFLIERDGVARWSGVNRVIPADIIKEFFIDQVPTFNKEATDKARAKETAAAVAAYRVAMAGHKPSDEEMYEMRAAFGRGTRVVNIITGRQTQL